MAHHSRSALRKTWQIRQHAGLEAVLTLAGLPVTLPLTLLYRRVTDLDAPPP